MVGVESTFHLSQTRVKPVRRAVMETWSYHPPLAVPIASPPAPSGHSGIDTALEFPSQPGLLLFYDTDLSKGLLLQGVAQKVQLI